MIFIYHKTINEISDNAISSVVRLKLKRSCPLICLMIVQLVIPLVLTDLYSWDLSLSEAVVEAQNSSLSLSLSGDLWCHIGASYK